MITLVIGRTKMIPAYKEAWLKRLRSPTYIQAKGRLKADYAFCPLGVLCDIFIAERPYTYSWDEQDNFVEKQRAPSYGGTRDPVHYKIPSKFMPPLSIMYTAGLIIPTVDAGHEITWAGLSLKNPNNTKEDHSILYSIPYINDKIGLSVTDIADLIEAQL